MSNLYEIDWNKVPVDTCILITDSYGYTLKRHFAKYDNKKITLIQTEQLHGALIIKLNIMSL